MIHENFNKLKNYMRKKENSLKDYVHTLSLLLPKEDEWLYSFGIDKTIETQENLLKRLNLEKFSLAEDTAFLEHHLKKIPDYSITARCRERIVKVVGNKETISTGLPSGILYALNSEMSELCDNFYTLSQEEVMQIILFVKSIINFTEAIYLHSSYAGSKIKETLWEYWDEDLTRFTSGSYSEFGAIFSMGDINFAEKHYPIISCSFVTQEHNALYNLTVEEDYVKAPKVGWYFRPSINDVLGMDITDAVANCTCHYRDYEKYKAIMQNRCFVTEDEWLYSTHNTFQSCYTPADLCVLGTYNEIVLRGNTKPDGVVILKKEYEFNYNGALVRKAIEVAKEKNLPLMVYDWEKNSIEMKSV